MNGEILRIVNGSRLYGTDVDTSDEDFVGVYVEPPDMLFLGREKKSVQLHDRPEGQRTVRGEVDGQAYSLRHFIYLTANGGPSQLCVLFAPEDKIVFSTEEGRFVLTQRDMFVSKLAIPRFKGYLQSQMLRLKREKTGHTPNRPELVEEFGFDTKYASHVARLALQGIEFLNSGVITLPMPIDDREFILAIRTGQYTYDTTIILLEQLEQRLIETAEKCTLRDEPDWQGLALTSRMAHQSMWSKNADC